MLRKSSIGAVRVIKMLSAKHETTILNAGEFKKPRKSCPPLPTIIKDELNNNKGVKKNHTLATFSSNFPKTKTINADVTTNI